MLSTGHRFLFIHVPKTGGNSIQGVLAPYSDDRIVRLSPHQDGVERFEVRSGQYRTKKHSTLSVYRREYGETLLDGLYKFCCVRNPWDRCISHYFSPHRGVVHWNESEFLRFVREQVRPLAYFLGAGSLREGLGNIDAVLRFERLQADFDATCRKLGLPRLELPRRNVSGKGDFRRFYDTRTARLVEEIFAEEIGLFGYSLSAVPA